ncbi:MAG: hypothetical protein ABEJ95_06135 [Candidatus Nanohalobium sp.]
MVWEVKCDNCGEVINWGGSEPSKYDARDEDEIKLGDEAIRFNDNVYCKECVKEFVRFGIGDVENRVGYLEDRMEEVMKAVGMEKGINPEG